MAQNNQNGVARYTKSDVMVPDGFTENVDLIIQTYAKDLTPQEFSLFAADAHQRGLSIVKRQIYAAKYSGKMTIMVGIDGYRSQAEHHEDYAGQDGPYWCGDDGQWRDVWVSKDPPVAAKVGIYRKGFVAPVTAVALFAEYNTGRDMWKKFPTVMLAKCAEAQAIRKAFPSKLGGTYIAEEMDQAHALETTARVVNQATGEIQETEEQQREKARAFWHIVLKEVGVDEVGKQAWYRAKGITSSNDVPPSTLQTWAHDFRDRPGPALAYIARLVEAQRAVVAPESDENPQHDETPAQGELIDITPDEEAQYMAQRRVEAATK